MPCLVRSNRLFYGCSLPGIRGVFSLILTHRPTPAPRVPGPSRGGKAGHGATAGTPHAQSQRPAHCHARVEARALSKCSIQDRSRGSGHCLASFHALSKADCWRPGLRRSPPDSDSSADPGAALLTHEWRRLPRHRSPQRGGHQRDRVRTSVEHSDQRRGSILAGPRPLHLVVLRPARSRALRGAFSAVRAGPVALAASSLVAPEMCGANDIAEPGANLRTPQGLCLRPRDCDPHPKRPWSIQARRTPR